MKNYICITCRTQFARTLEKPKHRPICEDERGVGENGRQ